MRYTPLFPRSPLPSLTYSQPRLALIKSIRLSNHQLSISNPAANLAAKNSARNSAKIAKLKLRREREKFSLGSKTWRSLSGFSLHFGGTNYA